MKGKRPVQIALFLALAAMALAAPQPQVPPVAKKARKSVTIHGETRVDDYHWLREKKNPEVASYLEAENAYTDAVLRFTEPFQKTLYDEMLGRIQQTDLTVPYRLGGFYYYSRTEKGKQYLIMCRKKGSLEAPEEVTLDVNQLAEGEKFMSLGAYSVSDDGNVLAFSTDNTGFRQYTLRFKDLRTGRYLPEKMNEVTSVTWAADNRTLFYVVADSAKRPYRLYRHRLGAADDVLLYEEQDERFRVTTSRSRSKEFIFLNSSSLTTSEYRFLRADSPADAWKPILPREQDHEYEVDHHGDRFYIRTNDGGRNFRLVSAPISDPRRENWKEILPHRSEVKLENVDFFKSHFVAFEREGGLPHLRVTDFRSGDSKRIGFPEPAYSAFPSTNREFDATVFRYSYQSFVTPESVFDYDMEKHTSTLLKQTEVLGGYDSSRYLSERIHATAADGTRIPISLIYRKGFQRDGRAPLLLTGYGSYGASRAVSFSSNRLSLLDRGLVFALAHIRGGGDLGQSWHDQGRMMKKKNTFTDFIACAEHLIAEKYTRSNRLVIEGGSAGGLLMGAVTNMRPDLFRAVVSHVPFVDVINTMLDESLPLTVAEFEEWGNPKKKAEYDYIKTYCPYTNLERKDYPVILVKTSFNDSQVMYWEPAKYVARLRTLKTDKNPLLLKVNMAGGHGGSSGRYDRLREIALDYAFILWQVGITQ